ncbi:MAG: nucleoside-diphosphate sugar epimerase/dehydratase [Puniceicoccaceae bacterium]
MVQSLVKKTIATLTPIRVVSLGIAYAIIFFFSVFWSFIIGFDFDIPNELKHAAIRATCWVIPLKLLAMIVFGQFRGLMMFFRLPDLLSIFWAMLSVSMVLLFVFSLGGAEWIYPRRVILMDLILSIVFLGGFRFLLRMLRERYLEVDLRSKKTQKVAIVGCGDSAARVASDLISKPGMGKRPMIFLVEESRRVGRTIHGLKMISIQRDFGELRQSYGIQQILIADRSLGPAEIQSITQRAKSSGLDVEIIPAFEEFISGRMVASQMRPVSIEDLLPREPVHLDSDAIQECFRGKRVIVTGAGGSIGSELCRQIIHKDVQHLTLIDQSEPSLYRIDQELSRLPIPRERFQSRICDITDLVRIEHLIREAKPDLIFHAAAHKHVPIMEAQPGEALKNNSIGTANLARIASRLGVSDFILISTDKAINPTSAMGASKRLAELAIQSVQNLPDNQTRFNAVRFGNVMGSSGSVIPLFKQQIEAGGPVTVTHPEVTRYFMTIPEAVGLVLQTATLAAPGAIFVLDMGQPFRIVDLARHMIQLSGFEPEKEILIEFVGLRPGEKLFEELQHKAEQLKPTSHPRILRFESPPPLGQEILVSLDAIATSLESMSASEQRLFFKRLIPEYQPYQEEVPHQPPV